MAAKTIPDSGFAGDDGSADPAVLAALHSADQADIVAALAWCRLLVPVTAAVFEEEIGAGGLRQEKTGHIALVLIKASNGLTALPAFTSLAALAAWRADARPVPARGQLVAASALTESADLVVIDPGGPSTVELSGPALWALAEGRPLLPPISDPEVIAALGAASGAEAAVAHAVIESPGDGRTDLRLRLVPNDGVAAADLQDAARRIAERLAENETLRIRLTRGIEIASGAR